MHGQSMKSLIISHGAEGIIKKITLPNQKSNYIISKTRIPKKYRLPQLDLKLRKQRTRREFRLLDKVRKIIPVPKIESLNENTYEIKMEFIEGKKLSRFLEQLNHKKISEQIGHNVAKLHNAGIIHGDLTTSNMILQTKTNKLYFIDFGLGFHSDRDEDKAVDLHVLSEALEAKHPTIFRETYQTIIKEYKKYSKNASKILKRLEKVEKRGRYKGQY